MTTEELVKIAATYARHYQAFLEAMLREGMDREEAKVEARHAATVLLLKEGKVE